MTGSGSGERSGLGLTAKEGEGEGQRSRYVCVCVWELKVSSDSRDSFSQISRACVTCRIQHPLLCS